MDKLLRNIHVMWPQFRMKDGSVVKRAEIIRN